MTILHPVVNTIMLNNSISEIIKSIILDSKAVMHVCEKKYIFFYILSSSGQ